MPAELDLTLPPHVPEVEKYGDLNHDLAQYALYTLLDVPLPQLQNLCSSIEADYIAAQGEPEPHLIAPAPDYNFAGKRLQDIFEHHLRFSEAQLQQNNGGPRWYALAFVVVNKPDWNAAGVLLVYTDWETCMPDSFQMPVSSETALFLTSLRDGDDDWEHLKESFQLQP